MSTKTMLVGWLAPDGSIRLVERSQKPMSVVESHELAWDLREAHPDQVYVELSALYRHENGTSTLFTGE